MAADVVVLRFSCVLKMFNDSFEDSTSEMMPCEDTAPLYPVQSGLFKHSTDFPVFCCPGPDLFEAFENEE